MTVIACIKKKIRGKTVVVCGSDSRTTSGSQILVAKEKTKMTKFPNFVVLHTGLAMLELVIDDLSKNKTFLKKQCTKMKNRNDAIAVAKQIFTNLRTRVEEYGENDAYGAVLIATHDSIYSCDSYGYGYEIDEIATDGSGGSWAYGSLLRGHSEIKTEQDMFKEVEMAMDVACMKTTGCARPFHVIKVEKE